MLPSAWKYFDNVSWTPYILQIKAIINVRTNPITIGKKVETRVHLTEPVSL